MAPSPPPEGEPHSSLGLEAEEGRKEKIAADKPVLIRSQDDGRLAADEASLRKGEDVLALQDLDPALNLKMHLVNNVSRPASCYHADRKVLWWDGVGNLRGEVVGE